MIISIDDRGNVSRGRAPIPIALRAAALDEHSVQDFLVRNLGHVLLIVRPHGTVMRWRPDLVSEETLAGLLYTIHDLGVFRLLLETFDGKTWQHRLIKWDSNEFGRLLDTEALGVAPAGTAWALRRQASASRISASTRLSRLLNFWAANKSKQISIDSGALREALNQAAGNRYCVVDAKEPGNLVVTAVGSGFLRQIQSVLLPCVGNNFTGVTDKRFGDFCVRAYGEAARSDEPTIEEIDTFIDVTSRRPLRRRYMRAILPIRSAHDCWLLGISFDDPSINLRVGGS